MEILLLTTATHLFDMGIRLSPVLLSENPTMTPSSILLLEGSSSGQVCTALVQPIRIHAPRLFWSYGLEYVQGRLWRYCQWMYRLSHRIHKKILDDVIPIVYFKTYLNQNTWIDGSLVGKLKEGDVANKQGKVTEDNSWLWLNSTYITHADRSRWQNTSIETKWSSNSVGRTPSVCGRDS